MKQITTIALVSMIATSAFAHSQVDTTTPENGAVVVEVPSEVSLNFSDEIRLTRVQMIHQDLHTVPLDLGDQTSFDHVFTLPLQGMGDGIYRIEWRGLGVDGHAMQGAFTFTVD